MKKVLLILATIPTFLVAQNITNTLGTGGNLEVKTSGGVEALTVTDGGQVIISDVANPTPKTSVILDLNSTDKTLQLPMLDFGTYIGVTAHDAGRIFWDVATGRVRMFYGTGLLDIAGILDQRDGIRQLKDVQGNSFSNSIYIGESAGTDGNGGNGPNDGDQNNVAFGRNALIDLGTADGTGFAAEENTAIGAYAGSKVTTGRGNTALGFQAGVQTGGETLNYTTAIGYGAEAYEDNQLVLGRTADVGGSHPATSVLIHGATTIQSTTTIQDVLKLTPMVAPPSGERGDIYYDVSTDKLMLCTATGTPGTWVALN